MIIDTHGHYDDKRFDEDRATLLNGLRSNGVEIVINSGADFDGCKDTLQMAKEYPFVYGTLGIHPNEAHTMTEEIFDWIAEHAKDEKIVAIGEMGLDYYYDEPPREVQKQWFLRQLALAKELRMPNIIHSREAAEETLKILKKENAGTYGGSIHCFSYSKEIANELIKIGFHIGVGGIVTFKNARKLKETVEFIPLESILLETDCPYLSPDPFRGERNDSSRLIYVAQEIAKLKGITTEEVIEVTTRSAKELFGIE